MSIFPILSAIFIVLLVLNIIREIFNIRSARDAFTCKHCGTFNSVMSNISKCKKCNRSIKIRKESWEHTIIRRVNWLPSESKTEEIKFSDYLKLPYIEMAISIIIIGILVTNILINYM